ncbi:MAG TPA: hypothetical protein VLA35_01600 [Thermoleophilia bacterium]|nr:hypothetical protein [Thermoleophilia bacterium]
MDLRHGDGLAGPSRAAGHARRSTRLRGVAVAALLLVAVAAGGALACGDDDSAPGPGPEPQPPAPSLTAAGDVDGADITGPLAGAALYDASPQGGAGPTLALLIEDGSGEYDKASITTTTETTWYEVVDGALAGLDTAPDATALSGRTVAVAFVGPVAESYPVQATAGWVVLLPAAD